MQYPHYPMPKENRTPPGTYPKDAHRDIMSSYDAMTSLGLQLLPKQYNDKLPVFKFWRKDDQAVPTRSSVDKAQQSAEVSGWCVRCGEASNRLLVIDLDTNDILTGGNDPSFLYERIQEMSCSGFVLGTPANGVHLYYRIPDDLEMLGNSAPAIQGLDVRGEGGQVVSLNGYNRYDNEVDKLKADSKGVVDGHTASYTKLPYGNYSYIPTMSKELHEWLTADRPEKRAKTKEQIRGENFGKTGAGQLRVERHFKQAPEDRERFVLECLAVVLDGWHINKSYDEWVQMWMAAHHGAEGSTRVRDMILESQAVSWSNGSAGRAHFRNAWAEHVSNEEGFTVASLFYLARQLGWLATTGYELNENTAIVIDVRYISDWLDRELNVPTRILLKSQTGTGKTYVIKNLWTRLGEPKSVIFTPTTKLATELSHTLLEEHGVENTLYIDDDTQKIASTEILVDAKVLVTTLQTFAIKVFPHVDMSQYGMVYVEESDQLISQFSRGGGGSYGTHVSDSEARGGFAVLRDAMVNSGAVWFVDATMTKLSYYTMEALRGGRDISIVINKRVNPKPTVTFVESKGVAYVEILKELEQGGRVVVSSDTKATALEVYQTMLQLGAVLEDKAILITANTKHTNKVKVFMRNVNEGSKKYSLVCYSPVMASGVSITATCPELLVQFSTWLTPRNNLQMLNRYRKQSKVLCFYSDAERLYGKLAQEILDEAKKRAMLEAGNVQIPLAIRNNDAELRAFLASTAMGDRELQLRAPKEFFSLLLATDGRSCNWSGNTSTSQTIQHTVAGVREARKRQAEIIALTWNDVAPIDRDNPPTPEMSDLDVAKGEAHAYILRSLHGNIPEGVAPEEIYRVVESLGRYGYHLLAFIKQQDTITRAETYLADDGRAITALANNVTMVKVISLVRHLYTGLEDKLTYEQVKERAPKFLEQLALHREMYDSIITRSRQQYSAILEKNDSQTALALAFSKVLLAKIGMRQRSERASRVEGVTQYAYGVQNVQDVVNFLEWREQDTLDIEFNDDIITEHVTARMGESEVFHNDLSEVQQSKVFTMMINKEISFQQAVNAVHKGDKHNGF